MAPRSCSRRVAAAAVAVCMGISMVACSDDSGSTSDSGSTATTAAAVTSDAPSSSTATSDGGPVTDPPSAGEVDGFAWRGPATGEPIVLGMVNTEGTPGLDFPEMRTDTDAAVEYLNAHGGMGGRPVQIEHCTVNGSPEASQSCAQELAGKGVDMVLLGLDLFPGYDSYAASGLPVVGALPILPGDYTADALFVTGGNLTTMAAMVALAVEHYDAKTAGIISADNPGANGSEASLTAALDKAGITYTSIKGGDNETDAGFQGLVRQATADNPDVLFSLYSDAGCIGSMRARASMAISTPAITTAICASAEVLDVVGDDALGWSFVGVGSGGGTTASDEFDEIVSSVHGEDGSTSIGLGALGINMVMTLARVANHLADAGSAVDGAAVYDALKTSTDLLAFPNDNPLACGLVAAYPSVCAFEFPIGEYVASGEVQTVPGFDAVSVVDYLP
ncbi:MAG: ABC transporter substrate-binding protein [Ilumatobacteraceae bacterium]|nr:ABC transporter substrate-binding protein [Ilumatobacter sp.]MCB0985602.1 ABC transporter substrate-binding protein [Ilumatobacter sp.]